VGLIVKVVPESQLEPEDGSIEETQGHSYAQLRVGDFIALNIYIDSRCVGNNKRDCGSECFGEVSLKQLLQNLGFICTRHCGSGAHA
jgi:hypothetical protein